MSRGKTKATSPPDAVISLANEQPNHEIVTLAQRSDKIRGATRELWLRAKEFPQLSFLFRDEPPIRDLPTATRRHGPAGDTFGERMVIKLEALLTGNIELDRLPARHPMASRLHRSLKAIARLHHSSQRR